MNIEEHEVGENRSFLGLIIWAYRAGGRSRGGGLVRSESGEFVLEDFSDDIDVAAYQKSVLSRVLSIASCEPNYLIFKLADGEGFEPSVPFRGTHAFQACPIDRSGTRPFPASRTQWGAPR